MNKHIVFGKTVKKNTKQLTRKNGQILAMAGMAALLTACGAATTPSPTPSPSPTPTPTPTPDPAKTEVFKVGVDILEGGDGDDVFIGTQNANAANLNTYQTGDSIDGGAGNDILKLSISDATAAPAINSTSVETVEIQTTVVEDFLAANFTGLTTIINKASTKDLTINNLTAFTDSVVENVVTAGADTTVMYNDSLVTGANDTVKTTFKNSTDAGDFIVGRQSDGAGIENLAVTVIGTNKVRSITSADGQKLTIEGAGDLTVTDTITNFTSIGITSSGKTMLSSAVAKVAITGAAGAETISIGHAAAANQEFSVNTGSGDDKITLATVSDAAHLADDKVVVDGGSGDDILVVKHALAASLSALSTVNYAKKGIANSFETLEISDAAGAGAVDVTKLGSNINMVDYAAGLGANSALTIASNGAVVIGADSTGFTLTVSVKDAAVAGHNSDVLNIMMDAAHGGAIDSGAIVAPSVETININSTTTKATAPVANTDTNDLDLTAVSATTIMIQGNVSLDLSGAAFTSAALATVDASLNTAGVSLSTNGLLQGIVFKGTSANDKIITGNGSDIITAGTGSDTLTGNAGNNKYIIAVGDSGATTATADIITDFKTTFDKFDLAAAGSGANYFEADATTGAADELASVEAAVTAANALVGASTSFDGTVQYIYIVDTAGGVNGYLVADMDLNGSADLVVQLSGLTSLAGFEFGDIV